MAELLNGAADTISTSQPHHTFHVSVRESVHKCIVFVRTKKPLAPCLKPNRKSAILTFMWRFGVFYAIFTGGILTKSS